MAFTKGSVEQQGREFHHTSLSYFLEILLRISPFSLSVTLSAFCLSLSLALSFSIPLPLSLATLLPPLIYNVGQLPLNIRQADPLISCAGLLV